MPNVLVPAGIVHVSVDWKGHSLLLLATARLDGRSLEDTNGTAQRKYSVSALQERGCPLPMRANHAGC